VIFVDRSDNQPIAPMSARAADGRALAPREIKGLAGPALAARRGVLSLASGVEKRPARSAPRPARRAVAKSD
jgi:hypothetical protein